MQRCIYTYIVEDRPGCTSERASEREYALISFADSHKVLSLSPQLPQHTRNRARLSSERHWIVHFAGKWTGDSRQQGPYSHEHSASLYVRVCQVRTLRTAEEERDSWAWGVNQLSVWYAWYFICFSLCVTTLTMVRESFWKRMSQHGCTHRSRGWMMPHKCAHTLTHTDTHVGAGVLAWEENTCILYKKRKKNPPLAVTARCIKFDRNVSTRSLVRSRVLSPSPPPSPSLALSCFLALSLSRTLSLFLYGEHQSRYMSGLPGVYGPFSGSGDTKGIRFPLTYTLLYSVSVALPAGSRFDKVRISSLLLCHFTALLLNINVLLLLNITVILLRFYPTLDWCSRSWRCNMYIIHITYIYTIL
jgi:hypothetical protein